MTHGSSPGTRPASQAANGTAAAGSTASRNSSHSRSRAASSSSSVDQDGRARAEQFERQRADPRWRPARTLPRSRSPRRPGGRPRCAVVQAAAAGSGSTADARSRPTRADDRARRQATAADRDRDRVDVRGVGDHLGRHRALARDDRGVLVRGHVAGGRVGRRRHRRRRRVRVAGAVADQAGARRLDPACLAGRDRFRDVHHRGQAEQRRGRRHREAVVAAGRRDHEFGSTGPDSRAFRAPRSLNEPVRCRCSSLNTTPAAVPVRFQQRRAADIRARSVRRRGHVGEHGDVMGRSLSSAAAPSPTESAPRSGRLPQQCHRLADHDVRGRRAERTGQRLVAVARVGRFVGQVAEVAVGVADDPGVARTGCRSGSASP